MSDDNSCWHKVPVCKMSVNVQCNIVRSLSCYWGFRENVMSLLCAGLTVLWQRHSSRVQIVSLPVVIDRCPTIPLALRRRSKKASSDLGRLINTLIAPMLPVTGARSKPLPWPQTSTLQIFIGPFDFQPHPYILWGHSAVSLRSRWAQMKCLCLIRLRQVLRWKPRLVLRPGNIGRWEAAGLKTQCTVMSHSKAWMGHTCCFFPWCFCLRSCCRRDSQLPPSGHCWTCPAPIQIKVLL